ncbi:unnamed protein product [Moneuplotes crassus]|uniref:Uncharacterized protein n=1 Tax=Euplotes crassus TaxID=5936 RepID=A0AAD1X6L3_EUPCR|nr:unnamed protein product [Moneuplotes crassus]
MSRKKKVVINENHLYTGMGALPPISPRTKSRNEHSLDKKGKTMSPRKYPNNFPGKRLYPEPKPQSTLEDNTDDKTGILKILQQTKDEIKKQIQELYDEGDPELFLQYAKTVSNYNPKLYVFDLYPTKPPKEIVEAARRDVISDSDSFVSSNRIPTKLSKKYLQKIKDRFNFNEQDGELPPKLRRDAIKFDLLHKQQKLERLNRELVKITTDHTDYEGLKKIEHTNLKLDYLSAKYDEVQCFKETLRYMLERDLQILENKKYTIQQLKAKKRQIEQRDKEVNQEIAKNKLDTHKYLREKQLHSEKFKNYIQDMNEAATQMLRDFEETMKVKEICRIIQTDDDSIKKVNEQAFAMQPRKRAKTNKLFDMDTKSAEKLEKYESDYKKVISRTQVRNVLELKDYYFHQQSTQKLLMEEIKDLEKERESKKDQLDKLKKTREIFKDKKDEKDKFEQENNNYTWVDDVESGAKLLILQDKTGFRHQHKSKIEGIRNRISHLKSLSSEALLVISRVAYQLKEDHQEIRQNNILQILSFCGLRLEYITNVLFKNRIYKLKQDPVAEDLGLKNICYASVKDSNDLDSTNYQEGNSGGKSLKSKKAALPDPDEHKYHQNEREKVKEFHRSNTVVSPIFKTIDKVKSSKDPQDLETLQISKALQKVSKMSNKKAQKQLKKMISIFK